MSADLISDVPLPADHKGSPRHPTRKTVHRVPSFGVDPFRRQAIPSDLRIDRLQEGRFLRHRRLCRHGNLESPEQREHLARGTWYWFASELLD